MSSSILSSSLTKNSSNGISLKDVCNNVYSILSKPLSMKFSLYSSNPKPLNHSSIEGLVKREFFEFNSDLKIPVLKNNPLSIQSN